MESIFVKRAYHELHEQIGYLRFLSNTNISEEDMEGAFNIACGYAWDFHHIGILTNPEAMEYIQRFADACEGR